MVQRPTVPVSPIRKAVGVITNAFGILATVAGLYFAYDVLTSIRSLAGLSRAQSAGLATPAIAVTGVFDVMMIFVMGILSLICLSIGAWILEPITRWRRRRSITRTSPPRGIASHESRFDRKSR